MTTEIDSRQERFTNLFSNRKPLQQELVENTQSSAQASDAEVSDAKVQQNKTHTTKIGNNLYTQEWVEAERDLLLDRLKLVTGTDFEGIGGSERLRIATLNADIERMEGMSEAYRERHAQRIAALRAERDELKAAVEHKVAMADSGIAGDVRLSIGEDELQDARRMREIRALKPIEVERNTMSKDELEMTYKNLPNANKNGYSIEFYHSLFGKNYRVDGLFAQVVPQLKEILESSILAYTEDDKLGGTTRPDGTTHKEHKNIKAYDNYIGKVTLDGKGYYVRTTVQHEENNAGAHSVFVTNIDLYENPTESRTIPRTPWGTTNFDGIVDAKLQQFFERASSQEKILQSIIEAAPRHATGGDEERYSLEEDEYVLRYLQSLRPDEMVRTYRNVQVLEDGRIASPMAAVDKHTGRVRVVTPMMWERADVRDIQLTQEEQRLLGELRTNGFYIGRDRKGKEKKMRRGAVREYTAELAERMLDKGVGALSDGEIEFLSRVTDTLGSKYDRLSRGIGAGKTGMTDAEWPYLYAKARSAERPIGDSTANETIAAPHTEAETGVDILEVERGSSDERYSLRDEMLQRSAFRGVP